MDMNQHHPADLQSRSLNHFLGARRDSYANGPTTKSEDAEKNPECNPGTDLDSASTSLTPSPSPAPPPTTPLDPLQIPFLATSSPELCEIQTLLLRVCANRPTNVNVGGPYPAAGYTVPPSKLLPGAALMPRLEALVERASHAD
ncbi:hypothetical protein LTR09_002377 [Extremus antarcticus]|uniref:Uncharacterized protein n=1 Tax=Extremus antarcticus TaxID=702011 RepID=A0AAJ0GFK7_9PEZI|nr:hypothetical protein LTR09_002377 [Extremus antarcticus]